MTAAPLTERDQQHPQCLFRVVDRERLEVLGADVVERDPHSEVEVALEREALQPGDAVVDRRLELRRDVVRSGELGSHRRPIAEHDVVEAVGAGRHDARAEVLAEALGAARREQLTQHVAGVGDGLLLSLTFALLEQRAAGKRVRHDRQGDGRDEGEQTEEQRHLRAQRQSGPAKHVPSVAAGRQTGAAMYSLLFIEDDDHIRLALSMALEDEGYDITQAANGSSGLALFDEREFDLVLLDLRLPDLSGFDVCRALRAKSIAPIIVVTAQTDTHDLVAGLEAGADDYVTKPVVAKELAARIRAHLRRVQLHELPTTKAERFGDVELRREQGLCSRAVKRSA